MFQFYFFLFFLFPFHVFSEFSYIPIDSVIQKQSVDDIITIFHNEPNRTDWNIYFNTPGGSVLEGIRLLPYFENYNMTCFVDKAYSMGFLLFQTCSQRYIFPYGSIMQHDMSLGIFDDYFKIKKYLEHIDKLYQKLIQLQIDKIGISRKNFIKRIQNNWWMNAEESISHNCADKIVPSMIDFFDK